MMPSFITIGTTVQVSAEICINFLDPLSQIPNVIISHNSLLPRNRHKARSENDIKSKYYRLLKQTGGISTWTFGKNSSVL
jgi:hypothetical protein